MSDGMRDASIKSHNICLRADVPIVRLLLGKLYIYIVMIIHLFAISKLKVDKCRILGI